MAIAAPSSIRSVSYFTSDPLDVAVDMESTMLECAGQVRLAKPEPGQDEPDDYGLHGGLPRRSLPPHGPGSARPIRGARAAVGPSGGCVAPARGPDALVNLPRQTELPPRRTIRRPGARSSGPGRCQRTPSPR